MWFLQGCVLPCEAMTVHDRICLESCFACKATNAFWHCNVLLFQKCWLHFYLATGARSLQAHVPHIAFACGPANVRDPQDHVPFALQSLPDTHQCQVTLHSRLPHRQVCPRDIAPTESRREMDNLRACGASTALALLSDNMPLVSNIHPSKPCSFHDPICRHKRMLPVRGWYPAYRLGCIPLATAVATAGR